MYARKPLNNKNTVKVTITVPGYVFDHLVTMSNEQGRSLSNLCSYLLERTIQS